MKITFAAVLNGTTVGTRSSGSMPYTDAVLVKSAADGDWAVLSWHLSLNGAVKASDAKYVQSHYAEVQIVPAVPTAVIGKFNVLGPNADIWRPLVVAAQEYRLVVAAQEYRLADAQRSACIRDELAKIGTTPEQVDAKAAKAAKARAIAERLNAEANIATAKAQAAEVPVDSIDAMNQEAIDGGANPFQSPAKVRAMFNGLGWSTTEPVEIDVDVVEPIVAVTAEGDVAPVDGLARPIVKKTRENMAACAAVGLSYWSDHPRPSHVWAVDNHQTAHVVRIDRKRGLAIIAEQNEAIGGNPLVSWSIDGDAAQADFATVVSDTWNANRDMAPVTIADIVAAAPDRVIVAHIGAKSVSPIAAKVTALNVAHDAALAAQYDADVAAGSAEPGVHPPVDADTAGVPLSVTARKAMLADMVSDALGAMVAGMTPEQIDALGDAEAVTGQIKMWLRRSGRALIYGDGKGVAETDGD